MEDGATAGKNEPVTISAPDTGAVTIDPQNPLPEPSFFWRRIIALAVTAACLALTWHNLEALHDLGDHQGLLDLAKWTLAFAGLVLTYYFVAPSAVELTNMIQSARIIRSGIGMAAQQANDSGKSGDSGRFGRPVGADSRFSESGPGEAPRVPYGGSGEMEADAAPRGRS